MARQARHQRLRLPLHQAGEGGLHRGQVVEVVHALGAAAQLAAGLGSAKHKLGNHRGFAPPEVEDLGQTVGMLGNSHVGTGDARCDALGTQAVERVFHGIFIERDHRLAVGFLVAGVHQGVHRHGVVFRGGGLFFHQAGEYARFDIIQLQSHFLY